MWGGRLQTSLRYKVKIGGRRVRRGDGYGGREREVVAEEEEVWEERRE